MLLMLAAAQTSLPCTASLCDADRLRPFFARLATARSGGEPVRILQIGDSHTAGDQISGAWRKTLQARYGTASRGMLAPGRPYAGYLTRGVTASQSSDWTVHGIFGPSYSVASTVPLGLTGYTLTTTVPGAWLSLTADASDQAFDRLTLCGWASPGAGAVQMTVGATTMSWSLDALVPRPSCHSVNASAPTMNAEVKVTKGPVTLTSWMIEHRDAGGVSLSNLGIVGSQFVHFERTDERLLSTELAVAHPDLIVVAFGTNEAFKPNFSATDYDGNLRRGIQRIHRLAPGIPVLMLGAPYSATSLPALQRGENGEFSTCPGGTGWAPPAALAKVQAIQRRRAHESGVAYWDWSMRMGGPCTADGWSRAGRMRGDRVHFTRQGAEVIAALLQQDLDLASDSSTPATVNTTVEPLP